MGHKTGLSTKDKTLLCLKNNTGFVSGEEISRRLALSRMAVSACVKTLRSEGYEIESVTRRGYKLLHSPDVLSAGEIAWRLQDTARMEKVYCLEETDSTNTFLLSSAMDNAPGGSVAVADMQTAGRGRMGRAFYSPKGLSVYLSYLICPPSDSVHSFPPSFSENNKRTSAPSTDTPLPSLYSPAAWTSLTSCTAVAVANAMERVCSLRPHIKWVNDLYLEEKKVTGILTQMEIEPESAHVRRIVIGIGVNANGKNEDFPAELHGIAGTLESACGHGISRAQLAAEIIRELDKMTSEWPACQESFLQSYRRDCFIVGKRITVITPGNPGRAAQVLEITDDFALRVRYEDGQTEDLHGGEISIRF